MSNLPEKKLKIYGLLSLVLSGVLTLFYTELFIRAGERLSESWLTSTMFIYYAIAIIFGYRLFSLYHKYIKKNKAISAKSFSRKAIGRYILNVIGIFVAVSLTYSVTALKGYKNDYQQIIVILICTLVHLFLIYVVYLLNKDYSLKNGNPN